VFNVVWPRLRCYFALSKQTIAHDKGKPVVKQGRKAVSLGAGDFEQFPGEIVWLPKASEKGGSQLILLG